jgi:hypothetical protein
LFDLRRRHPLPHRAWAGLASPAVRGAEDRELTFEVGDGATGLGMGRGSGTTTGTPPAASRPKEGSVMGLATMIAQRRRRRWRHRGRWRRWRGIEGGGGVEGGKLGQPDGTNPNFTVIKVSCRWGYSPYTRYVIGIC